MWRQLAIGFVMSLSVVQAMAADCVNGVEYTTPGALTCTIPAGVTTVKVVAKGAGGGGGYGAAGGSGATVRSTLTVSPTQVLSVFIGGRGTATGFGGGGGGSTNIDAGTANQIIAGGGGGGGGAVGGAGGIPAGASGGIGSTAAASMGGNAGVGGLAGVAQTLGTAPNTHYCGDGSAGANGNGGPGGAGGTNTGNYPANNTFAGAGSGAGAGAGGGYPYVTPPTSFGTYSGTVCIAQAGGGGGGYGGGGSGATGLQSDGGGAGGGSIGPAGTTYALASNGGATNANGQNGSVTFYFPPQVTAISPGFGPIAGGTSVTITGTDLSNATGVTIGGNACTSLSANTVTSVTCTSPAGTAGTASVLVTTAGGTNAANSLFSYQAPTPTISPSGQTVSGRVGTAITATSALTGSNFTGSVSYTVTPGLPAGLTLDPSTGVISGTPTATQSATTHTITGAGATSGSATTTVSIKVLAIQVVGGTSYGTALISNGGFVAGTSQFTAGTNPPAGKSFPYGVFGFTAETTSGGTVTLTMTYPQVLPSSTKYLKLINGAWVDWTSRVTVSGNTATYSVTDGEAADSNAAAGLITDPFGPAIEVSEELAKIPTLSEWALMFLASLMGMLAIVRLRKS